MRIAIVAFWVRGGAMGPLVQGLSSALALSDTVHLFVPEHFDLDVSVAEVLHFQAGRTSLSKAWRQYQPAFWHDLWHRILASNPDIVHFYNAEGHPAVIYAVGQSKKLRIPTVVSVHDPDPHPGRLLEQAYSKLRKFSLRKTTIVHIFSECFRTAIESEGVEPSAIRHVPLANISKPYLSARTVSVYQSHVPTALFFGRIEAYKGIATLIAAGKLLGGRMRIVLAGPGEISTTDRNAMNAAPECFEVINHYITEARAAELFQAAKVCVMPYYQATQSTLPAIAAAFNLPVVASDIGGLREDVTRVNGILVPPRDPVRLAQALLDAEHVTPVYPRELDYISLVGSYREMYNLAIMREVGQC
jgi:glycosyltransferase involved in cell wall biosynthesis